MPPDGAIRSCRLQGGRHVAQPRQACRQGADLRRQGRYGFHQQHDRRAGEADEADHAGEDAAGQEAGSEKQNRPLGGAETGPTSNTATSRRTGCCGTRSRDSTHARIRSYRSSSLGLRFRPRSFCRRSPDRRAQVHRRARPADERLPARRLRIRSKILQSARADARGEATDRRRRAGLLDRGDEAAQDAAGSFSSSCSISKWN